MIRAATILACALLLSGCATPAAVEAPAPATAPALTVLDLDACEACFEPTLTALPSGRLAVLSDEILLVDLAAGVSTGAARPELPASAPPGSRSAGDGLVQTAPDGRLFYSNLVFGPQGRTIGVHVASSSDEGASWDTNVYLTSTPAPVPALGADRQWLAFGPDDIVYASWAQQDFVSVNGFGNGVATGLWVARSDDGGASFGEPVRAAAYEARFTFGQAGAPVVDADGRVMLPYVTSAICGDPTCTVQRGERTFSLAVSTDQGATWTQEVVHPGLALAFPTIVVAEDARYASFWDGEALYLRRDAGEGWSEPEAYSDPALRGWFGAALLPRPGGGVDVASYDAGEEDCALFVARGAPSARTVVATGLQPQFGRACPSDLASAARLPDGGIALVWGDAEEGALRVALLR